MRLTKKERVLYSVHARQYDIIIKHYITISDSDSVNILKIHDRILDKCDFILKRDTRKIRIFNKYIYFNRVYGGIVINERTE